MKVLVMNSYPDSIGGLETTSLTVSKSLASKRHQVFLVYTKPGNLLPSYRQFIVREKEICIDPYGLRDVKKSLKNFFELLEFIKNNNIDVIFSTNLGHFRISGIVRKFVGIESVYHLGLPGEFTPDIFTRWGSLNVYAGITPSKATQLSWEHYGWNPKRLFVCPNWLDYSRFNWKKECQSDMRKELGLPINVPIILFVGRLTIEKGIEVLIRAFAEVVKLIPESLLVLVGNLDINYIHNFKSMLTHYEILDRQVFQVGVSSKPEDYYCAADIAVVPPVSNETFGLTLLEAMACGTLVLASKTFGFKSIVGESNVDLLFEVGNSTELSEKICFWLVNKVLRLQRGFALHTHSITQYGDNLISVYETILSSASEHSSLQELEKNCKKIVLDFF